MAPNPAEPARGASTDGRGAAVVSETPDARIELADSLRALIQESVHTQASVVAVREAATEVDTITAALRRDGERAAEQPAGDVGRSGFSTYDPVEGPSNPMAPPLTDIRVGDAVVHATATLGSAYEGAPGRAHGGWVASLLDHALGRAAASVGMPGMTVSLTIEYHDATPHGVPLAIEARVTSNERRKVYTTANIQYSGRVTASATALLVAVEGLPEGVGTKG